MVIIPASQPAARFFAQELGLGRSEIAPADDEDRFKDLGVLEGCIDFEKQNIPTSPFFAANVAL